jgi:predicted dehydrogenase
MGEQSFTKMAGAKASGEAPVVGVGMLGYAFMGKAHSNAYKKLPYMMYPPVAIPKLVAIAGRNEEATAEAARRFGYERYYTDWHKLIEDPEIQLFDNGGPGDTHAEPCIAAAQAGKHVFCEKPLALRRADAERAVNACGKAGVALAVGSDKRLWPSMRELKRVVDSGVLGEVLHIEGHFSNETSHQFHVAWRDSEEESPGAGMTATGIHVLDAFVNLMGPVRRVQAQLISRRPPPRMLDTVSAIFEFENGTSGLLGTFRVTPFYWRVQVFGEKGNAEALGETELVLRMTGEKPQRRAFEAVDALRLELDAFADAAAGRAPFPVTAAQMVATVAALEAMNKAMETGAGVRL